MTDRRFSLAYVEIHTVAVLATLAALAIPGCTKDESPNVNREGTGGTGETGTSGSAGLGSVSGNAGTNWGTGQGGSAAGGGWGGSNGHSGISGVGGANVVGGHGGSGGIDMGATAGTVAQGGASDTGGVGGEGGGGDNAASSGAAGSGDETFGSSCAGLVNECGAAHADDCCSTGAIVEGGETFYRDYDAAPDAYNTQSWPAIVDSFRLDRYEVTVGRFRRFVDAYNIWRGAGHPLVGEGGDPHVVSTQTAWTEADLTASNLAIDAATLRARISSTCSDSSWTNNPAEGDETNPINCINWYEAKAFCLWDGGWLPTETEWMYAAAGGSENRAYPWSSPASDTTVSGAYANFDEHVGHVQPVGTYPSGAGRWLQEDLGGNVLEWVVDSYLGMDSYPGTAGELCDNCAETKGSVDRVLRGGNLHYSADWMRSAWRAGVEPTSRGAFAGVRCARNTL